MAGVIGRMDTLVEKASAQAENMTGVLVILAILIEGGCFLVFQ